MTTYAKSAQAQLYNSVSLLPKSDDVLELYFSSSRVVLRLLGILYLVFATISFLFSLSMLVINLQAEKAASQDLTLLLSDLSRMTFYALILVIGRYSPRVQIYGTYVFPILFSSIVTEVYIYIGASNLVLPRILSVTGLLVLSSIFIPIQYPLALIPPLFSFIYPTIRAFSNEKDSILLIVNTLLTFLFAVYKTKEAYVSDICGYYSAIQTSTQWKNAMQTFQVGIVVMSQQSKALLFFNSSLVDLFSSLKLFSFLDFHKPENQTRESLDSVSESIKGILENLTLKQISTDGSRATATLTFNDLLAKSILAKESSYFLEQSEKLIEIRTNALVFENEKAVLFSFFDCSAAQRLEQLQSESKYKTLLISTISHELRTPVNSVVGSLDILSQYIPAESLKILQIAKDSCNLLTYHINDLTDYGKLGEEHIVLIQKPTCLKDVVTFCLDMVRYNAEQKGLQLGYSIIPGTPDTIAVDERRLKQVILNLLSNAVKFTEKGAVTIIVKQKMFQNKKVVKIGICDTGMGIKEEDIPMLCREFKMLKTHQSVNPNGTGLGLFLCKKLINLMKGDLLIKSVYKEGSEFSIILPINDEMLTEESKGSNTERISKKIHCRSPSKSFLLSHPLSGPDLLIVDDSPMSLHIMETMLRKGGIYAETASNGKDAIHLVKTRAKRNSQEKPYSLIIMDINMPVMNGVEAATKLKKMMEEGHIQRTPIVALSGEGESDIAAATREGVFDDILQKPITSLMLKAIVEKHSKKELVLNP